MTRQYLTRMILYTVPVIELGQAFMTQDFRYQILPLVILLRSLFLTVMFLLIFISVDIV